MKPFIAITPFGKFTMRGVALVIEIIGIGAMLGGQPWLCALFAYIALTLLWLSL